MIRVTVLFFFIFITCVHARIYTPQRKAHDLYKNQNHINDARTRFQSFDSVHPRVWHVPDSTPSHLRSSRSRPQRGRFLSESQDITNCTFESEMICIYGNCSNALDSFPGDVDITPILDNITLALDSNVTNCYTLSTLDNDLLQEVCNNATQHPAFEHTAYECQLMCHQQGFETPHCVVEFEPLVVSCSDEAFCIGGDHNDECDGISPMYNLFNASGGNNETLTNLLSLFSLFETRAPTCYDFLTSLDDEHALQYCGYVDDLPVHQVVAYVCTETCASLGYPIQTTPFVNELLYYLYIDRVLVCDAPCQDDPAGVHVKYITDLLNISYYEQIDDDGMIVTALEDEYFHWIATLTWMQQHV